MKRTKQKRKLFTISEFRHEVGIPLVLAKKLIIWGFVKAGKTVDGTLVIASSDVEKTKSFLKSPYRKTTLFIKALGPGLITGAADDDPGGIGTYSSVLNATPIAYDTLQWMERRKAKKEALKIKK